VEGAWSVLGGERDVEVDGDDAGEIEDNWVASVRGRLGYAFGSTLVYGTGGVAFLNTDDADPFDDTLTGWVAGAGVEHKLRDNLSLGLEGLYYSFEDDVSESADGLRATADLERDFWTVQARITYHFGDRHGGESLK
jgi:outer membrane immunogenic protein